MPVYVVYYDEVTRGREGPEEYRRIHGVYDSAEKARTVCRELSKNGLIDSVYADFDEFEVE